MAKPATTDGTRTADPTAWWRHAGFDIPDPVRVARLLARRPELEQELRRGAPHLRQHLGSEASLRLVIEVLPHDERGEMLWIMGSLELTIDEAESRWDALMDDWGEEAYRATNGRLCVDVVGR